ncbi:WhiB family transcriptional regulator (plasmid) [Streptomyces sp. SDT5-1]|uniref:WhiB family transcriptional regulator n=1 Tax=Streptomyces sp. SDT5-1 TaxID=3406418 RepID=UPI003FD5C885
MTRLEASVHAIIRTAAYRNRALSTAAPAQPRPACADEDPDLFFPDGETGPALLDIAEAKKICRRCPLIAQCLKDALDRDESGVWGCTSEQERSRIKRNSALSHAA